MDNQGPHQRQPLVAAGISLDKAKAALILVHGRYATAQNILMGLGNDLYHPEVGYLAPQAANNSWYPYSFLAPLPQNEPGLSSGLQAVANAVKQVQEAGIPTEKIILGGFSQGACLASEFVAQNAERFGGLLVFSGGVIGPPKTPRNYGGNLEGTPIFIGCSDQDSHIPLECVKETTAVFQKLGGNVTEKIYPSMGHTIIQDELDHAQQIVATMLSS